MVGFRTFTVCTTVLITILILLLHSSLLFQANQAGKISFSVRAEYYRYLMNHKYIKGLKTYQGKLIQQSVNVAILVQ